MGSRRFRCRSRKTGNSNLAAVSVKAESALHAIGVLDQGGSSFGRAMAGPGKITPAIRPWFRRMPNRRYTPMAYGIKQVQVSNCSGFGRAVAIPENRQRQWGRGFGEGRIGAIRQWRMASRRFRVRPRRSRSRKTNNGNEAAVSVKAESALYATGVLNQGGSGFDLFRFRPYRGRSRGNGPGNEAAVSADAESALYATGVWDQGGSGSVNAEPALYAIGVSHQRGSGFGRAVAGPGKPATAMRPRFWRMPNRRYTPMAYGIKEAQVWAAP
jgi:hypothetical protein